jgi:predicted RNA-binding protein with PIN domain
MPILIDGNNLLFAARDEDPERPIGRSKLCEILGRWACRRGQKVHVVFDGPAPTAGLAEQIGDPSIAVDYSGSGVSADARLRDILEGDSAARRLLVVSSDREIVRAAKRRRACPVASDEFWNMVQRDLSQPERESLEPPEKRRGLGPGVGEDWLRELGL